MNPIISKYFAFLPVVMLRNENVFKELKALKKSQWYPMDYFLGLQRNKLNSLIKYAKSNVPYYRDVIEDPVDDDYRSLLENIPILTKDIIREQGDRLLSDKKPILRTVKTTGGSTGEPVTILKTSKSMSQERAALWRGYSWAKIDIGDRQARFWGIPFKKKDEMMSKLVDLVNNRKRLSAFNFDDKQLLKYYNQLNTFKPKYFYGYVSLLKEFARFLSDKSLQLQFELKAVITTAEELVAEDRQFIEEVFNCRAYNEYGSGEIGTIAHECDHGNLHINSENVIVEIVDDNGRNLGLGEKGQLLVTELNNTFFPLIRYQIGDIGTISKISCGCGRGLPVLEGVYGRAYDFVTTPDGKRYHPSFFNYVFKEFEKLNYGIKQFQVVQENIENLSINLVVFKNLDEGCFNRIKDYLNEQIGYNFYINIHVVDIIPREKSGKLRVVKGIL